MSPFVAFYVRRRFIGWVVMSRAVSRPLFVVCAGWPRRYFAGCVAMLRSLGRLLFAAVCGGIVFLEVCARLCVLLRALASCALFRPCWDVAVGLVSSSSDSSDVSASGSRANLRSCHSGRHSHLKSLSEIKPLLRGGFLHCS